MKIKNVVAYCLLACMFCCFPGCQDSDDVGENYTTFYGGDHQRLFAEQRGLFGFRGSFEDGGGFFPAGIIRLIHLFCAEQHGDGGVCERTGLRVVRAFSGFRGGGQGNGVLSPDRRRSQRSGKL